MKKGNKYYTIAMLEHHMNINLILFIRVDPYSLYLVTHTICFLNKLYTYAKHLRKKLKENFYGFCIT